MYRKRQQGEIKFSAIVPYIDDFCIVAESEEDCRETQLALIQLLGLLGFLVAWAKVISPAQWVIFLGICIDACSLRVSLPQDKIVRLKDVFSDLYRRKSSDKIGASTGVWPG